ncbi:hypothetical protein 015DV002_103 [Bacillus phage 015DV002]|nr:hypothetical protein 000TH008_113 [Bacillus phage 000TH008]QQO40807.1 hypothetical protein 000TH009_113 [Bacillus phage 000TH009]QQO41057.1 hypothetical protein 015DV002_103 [Bacillus phage 015DV002]QQO41335.1 hypothetical protein 015DV004_120 [Bacillus phage 015DV004]
MSMLTTIAVACYTLVGITFILNLESLFSESKKLKEQGQHPLTGNNIFTLVLRTLAETLTVFLVILLFTALNVNETVTMGVAIVTAVTLLRGISAYAATLLALSITIRIGRRKKKKEIEKEIEEEEAL